MKEFKPSIIIFAVDGGCVVLTSAYAKGAFTYLGMTNCAHSVLWTKFEAGVPGVDSTIVDVIETAQQLGYKGEFKDET